MRQVQAATYFLCQKWKSQEKHPNKHPKETRTNKTHPQTTHLYFTFARAPMEVLKTSSVPN